MPDHWHALLFPAEGDALPRLMDSLKVASTRGINRARQNGPLWQPRYYDHAIRDVKEYHDTLSYMHFNRESYFLVNDSLLQRFQSER